MLEPHADHHRFDGATVTILKATKKPMKIPHTPYSQIHVICTRCTEPGAEVGFCLCPTSATLHCSLNKNKKIMPHSAAHLNTKTEAQRSSQHPHVT